MMLKWHKGMRRGFGGPTVRATSGQYHPPLPPKRMMIALGPLLSHKG